MATKTVVHLVDDLTEEPAETTVQFGIDGREYELDLTDANAQELRDLFARYIAVARRLDARCTSRPTAGPKPFSGFDPAAVRAWAAGNGITVNARGRIKSDVIEAYRSAGN